VAHRRVILINAHNELVTSLRDVEDVTRVQLSNGRITDVFYLDGKPKINMEMPEA
jgi:hypothetical protein